MAGYEDKFVFSRIEDKTAQGRLSFFYELHSQGNVTEFQETLEFTPSARQIPFPLLQQLHVLLGMSYWKTRVPKILELPNQTLSRKDAEFWNTVYTKGLGEFFYKNKIDFRGLIQFPSSGTSAPAPVKLEGGQSLVLLGGGKDSILTAELMKRDGRKFAFFALNPHPVQETIAKRAGAPLVSMTRTLDDKLFALNRTPGVFNGHVPISAIYAFTGILAALLYGYDWVIASNEKSANYGNVAYLGSQINHQWSKSIEFEKALQQYYPRYFSILRPLSEFKIVELFSRYPMYFPLFTSCNKNFTHTPSRGPLWCGKCPKCAFVFMMLSAFLDKETLEGIFGHNLYEDRSLLLTFEELLGLRAIKPFDCVGTPEEAQEAVIRAFKSGSYNDVPLLRELAAQSHEHPLVRRISSTHAIPKEFLPVVRYL